MINYVKSGDNLTLVAPYDVLSGGGFKVGNVFGVAANDTLSGNNVECEVEGDVCFGNRKPVVKVYRIRRTRRNREKGTIVGELDEEFATFSRREIDRRRGTRAPAVPRARRGSTSARSPCW